MLYAAASAEPSRGWGGPLAILAAFAAFRLLMPYARRLRDKVINPSPTPALPTAERVKVHATVGVTPDDTDDTDDTEIGWWGRIVEIGGHRYRQAEQVWRTGSSELPPPDDEVRDEAIDLALDGDEAEPAPGGAATRDPVVEYIDRADRMQISYGQMVKVLVTSYGISESTAKRRIRDVRAART